MVSIRYRRKAGMHVFSVKDNGMGIPRKHAQKVFDIFYRGYETYAEGTGIGLSIVKKAVNIMGGEVRLRSAQGKGSVFSFSLPMD